MKPIVIKNTALGEGIPKICVPIVARTQAEAVTQAQEIVLLKEEQAVDLVEWRADWMNGVEDWENCLAAAKAVRAILADLPLLFTIRTRPEGGEQDIPQETYLQLTEKAAQSGLFDLVDVELSAGEENIKRILHTAHANGVYVIASNHDFHSTPAREELLSRLTKMDVLGADILKIAVMPQCADDVLTLLSATEEMSRRTEKPLITMSMSVKGAISRLSGEVFGSCMTFGTAKQASAPGQISAVQLKEILNLLHG